MSSRLLFLAVAAGAGLWAFRHWRQAVQFAMVLLVVEGAIRKWVVPGAEDLVYFAKDGILLAAYGGYFAHRRAGAAAVPHLPALEMLLAVSAFVGLLQVLNPLLPNLWVGLFGFKAYFLYIPLIWLVPASFGSKEELWRFLYRYALLAIPLGILALFQFGSSSSSAINTYARPGEGGAFSFGSSSHARVTSTFSFITGYVSYLYATSLVILTVLGVARWELKKYLLLYAALALTVVGMMASGSRAPVLLLVLTLPLYAWLFLSRDRGGIAIAVRLMVAIGVLAVFLAAAATDVVGAFYGRASGTDDATSRILSPFVSPFTLIDEAGALGFGIGATHQAATALVDTVSPFLWLGGLAVEDESGRVMLELGPFGFILIYGARILLTAFAALSVFVFHDRFARAIAVTCFLYFLTSIPGGIVFNVTAGLYYWFFAGLLFLAVRFDREAVAPAALAAPARAATRAPHLPPRPAAAARGRLAR